jgi:hypothetical protein
MEFNRLADVEVVETANDTDKVLIEQNGEIKRVPKTEVGGVGNMLIVDLAIDTSTGAVENATANMTLDECMAAIKNHELTGAVINATQDGMAGIIFGTMILDYTAEYGAPAVVIEGGDMPLMWTADGFVMVN